MYSALATPETDDRLYPNQDEPHLEFSERRLSRSAFQRDRDRIIHSRAFQRLRHKTQVFVSTGVNQYRSRLTHSLEVAQIARSLARGLGVNEDLTEAIALIHDLGHPPFGHSGEDALKDAMAEFGGYDHNIQAVRLATRLEHRYPTHPGMNLTLAALEGMIKHNGPLVLPRPPDAGLGAPGDAALARYARRLQDIENKKEIYTELLQGEHPTQKRWVIDFDTYPGIEAQLAAVADDIAYLHHDLDDGLVAGLFAVEDLLHGNPFFAALYETSRDVVAAGGQPEALHQQLTIDDMIRCGFGAMVNDVFVETADRLKQLPEQTYAAVLCNDAPVVAMSTEMAAHQQNLRKFLFARMYRSLSVNRENTKGARMIAELFDHFMKHPQTLDADMATLFHDKKLPEQQQIARRIADVLSALTDAEAKLMYQTVLPRM
ncbi:MAG: dNTP triphosphohydrolase [Alphaproteobacteria bacterium]|nr:dNTP triphosphohydrolase [Alphaproteobacteria bacterium]